MAISIPRMNPIRFYNAADMPDYSTKWPVLDTITQRAQYVTGWEVSEYYKDHVINRPIYLQFRVENVLNTDLIVVKPSGALETITANNINPDSWTGNDVKMYTYTPTTEGVHYFYFSTDSNIKSDKFMVHSVEKMRKRLVEIRYYNSGNDYGMIFYKNSSTKYYEGLTYFEGIIEPIPENQISGFVSDRGELEKLRATPVNAQRLTLAQVHKTYANMINLMFSCDVLFINGVEYQSDEAPEMELKERSDLMDVTIKLLQRNDNYFNIEL